LDQFNEHKKMQFNDWISDKNKKFKIIISKITLTSLIS
jgi:hypothetical protein